MQKFILDKSFLIGCKGDEIEKSDDLILCSVLLYELKKEIKKEPKTKKQMKKDFHSSLKVKNIKEKEKENIQTMVALIIAVTSDENLLSIFEKNK